MDITQYINTKNIPADIYTTRRDDVEYTIIVTKTTWQRIRTDKIYSVEIIEEDEIQPATLEISYDGGDIKINLS